MGCAGSHMRLTALSSSVPSVTPETCMRVVQYSELTALYPYRFVLRTPVWFPGGASCDPERGRAGPCQNRTLYTYLITIFEPPTFREKHPCTVWAAASSTCSRCPTREAANRGPILTLFSPLGTTGPPGRRWATFKTLARRTSDASPSSGPILRLIANHILEFPPLWGKSAAPVSSFLRSAPPDRLLRRQQLFPNRYVGCSCFLFTLFFSCLGIHINFRAKHAALLS